MDKKAFVGYDDSDTEPESTEEDEFDEDIAQSQKSWSSTNSKNSDGDYSYHTANGLDFLAGVAICLSIFLNSLPLYIILGILSS